MKQMRLPMVAPVRPRIVSTKERKGKEKHWITFWSCRAVILSQRYLYPGG